MLALANLHVYKPIVKGKDKVHASIVPLAPIKPHCDLTPKL